MAMIYSHSHADHFGGSAAIKAAFPDVKVYGSKYITKEIVEEVDAELYETAQKH